MSKKDNHSSNNGASLGEISTIRDILMGQHINDFEAQFQALQKQLERVEDKFTQKIKDLSSNSNALNRELNKDMIARFSQLESLTDSRFSEMESTTDGRIGQLEQSLKDGLTDLQNKMEESSMNDKERIGQLLMEAGQNLLKP